LEERGEEERRVVEEPYRRGGVRVDSFGRRGQLVRDDDEKSPPLSYSNLLMMVQI
jgi:hypothetical protein